MIHTWDMVSERFGWMLVWGDYVLVPFFYSLAGWWLIHAPEPLSPIAATAIGLLFVFGFWLFRGANEQKHRFKRDPEVTIWGQPARSLDGRLLVSGFWGIGRHLNYTGEICIYLAFTLTTGLASWVPYLLPAWAGGVCCGIDRGVMSAAAAPSMASCGDATRSGCVIRCCRLSIEGRDGTSISQCGNPAFGASLAAGKKPFPSSWVGGR